MPADWVSARKGMKMMNMPLDDLVDFLEMEMGGQKPAAKAELARRAALAAQRQAEAAERAAEATIRYTRYTLGILVAAALAAVFTAVAAAATWYAALNPR